MNDETLQMTMLFDFYGELLTEKQREYFDLYHNEDLSLSEIAKKANISRHGVYDTINRAENILQKTEKALGIVARWLDTNKELENAESIIKKISELAKNNNEITNLTDELHSIIKEIKEL